MEADLDVPSIYHSAPLNSNVNQIQNVKNKYAKKNAIKSALTFFDHSNCEALLVSTVLTSVPSSFVDRAVFVRETHVLGVFLHCSLKYV
jgi:hypothetical protein